MWKCRCTNVKIVFRVMLSSHCAFIGKILCWKLKWCLVWIMETLSFLGKSGCIQSIHRRIILLFCLLFLKKQKWSNLFSRPTILDKKVRPGLNTIVAKTGQNVVTLENIFKDQVRSILIYFFLTFEKIVKLWINQLEDYIHLS